KMPREELALKLVEMIVDGKFGKFTEEKAAEQAIRTALAVLTEGIVIAPLEGITEVKIKKNMDGSPYLALYFASPIRAAGGTAAALAVLAGDFARRKLHLSPYKPTEKEARRFAEEVEIYHNSIAREQYKPPEEDILFAVQNLPVEVTGEPTERDISVTAYRDLERIEHNFIRGGAVLALTEGVMQKASKIMKYVNKLNIDGWGWLADIISRAPTKEKASAFPKGKAYLGEVIAGRPVFSHPGTEGHRGSEGGFRLRYGRARNTGIAAIGVHPATMVVCDDFLAVGTQLKTERPGKGGAVVPVDSIEGPVVKLRDGSVVQLRSVKEALELRDKVEEILFLGDILISFGEFLENNHPLMPAGYSEEWWSQEVSRALKDKKFDVELDVYCSPPYPRPSPELAVRISERLGVPLHPAYTYHYHDLKVEELGELGKWLVGGKPEFEGENLRRLRVPLDQTPKRLLEELGVPHRVEGGHVLIEEHSLPLCRCLGLLEGTRLSRNRLEGILRSSPAKDVMEIVQSLAGFPVRRKAPTRIGARMGRPEKASPRKMKPPVHVLFPVGMRGGSTRNLVKAAETDEETYVEVVNFKCPKCGAIGLTRKCQNCGSVVDVLRTCSRCGRSLIGDRCPACNAVGEYFSKRGLRLKSLFETALDSLGEERPELVKGVQGMTSEYKIPEPIEKGILRAKHGVYVFKDGTIRFDATNVPLTHFKPKEIGTPVERLRELGYTRDIFGAPLEREDQILELKVQDILVSREGAEYLFRASKFIDELLQKFYGLPSYYNARSPSDLVGHIVMGLAPHTSVGVAGRIIGFTDASVGYAHP
ncbi:MAG TPA: DNA polymerase II large subunit, partial [Hadesarchaea archaeon]|nr:DNA polymerase II large subunit [Hadesarchaea archaeon]